MNILNKIGVVGAMVLGCSSPPAMPAESDGGSPPAELDGGSLPACSSTIPSPTGAMQAGVARVMAVEEVADGVRVDFLGDATFSVVFPEQPALETDDEVILTEAGRGVWIELAGAQIGYAVDDDSWYSPSATIDVPGADLALSLEATCSSSRPAPAHWSCTEILDMGYAITGDNGPIVEGSNGVTTGADGRRWLVHVDVLRDSDIAVGPNGMSCLADLPSNFRLAILPAP